VILPCGVNLIYARYEKPLPALPCWFYRRYGLLQAA
jgi:hypothetical protein